MFIGIGFALTAIAMAAGAGGQPAPSYQDIVLKQTGSSMQSGTAATGTITMPQAVTAGNTLMVVLGNYQGLITSVVGAVNGAFTKVLDVINGGDNRMSVWTRTNTLPATAGQEIITVTPETPATAYASGTCAEFSGLGGPDKTSYTIGSFASTNLQDNAVAKSLVLTGTINNVGGTEVWATPTGYTLLDRDANGNTSTAHQFAYKVVSAVEKSSASGAGAGPAIQAEATYDTFVLSFSASPVLYPLNSRIVYFGDSLTDYDKYDGRKQYTGILSGARFYTNPSFDQGIAGQNTTQMLARIGLVTAQIIPGKTLVPFLGGTNDISSNPSILPGDVNTAGTSISNINQIVTQLVTAGAKVLIHTIWKRGIPQASYPYEAQRQTVNTFIRSLAGTPGVTVFDVDSVYNPETMSDEAQGLHPNPYGAFVVASAEAPLVASFIDPASILVGQSGNLLVNPGLTGTGGTLTSGTATGVVANNWRLYRDTGNLNGTVVGSKEVGSDGVERQVVTVTANGTGACWGYFETAAVVPTGGLAGELFEAWVGTELDNGTNLNTASACQIIWNGRAMNGSLFGALDHSGVLRTIPIALAADQTTGVRLQFLVIAQANSTTTVKFRSPMARKVPAGQ